MNFFFLYDISERIMFPMIRIPRKSNKSQQLLLVGSPLQISRTIEATLSTIIYTPNRNGRLLGTDHLTCRGGGVWFFVSFRNLFSDNTRVRIFFLLPEFNIRLYDEHSESHYFFSSTKIRIFFSATLGILEKTHNPPPSS